jgi:hypothetical protein
MFEHEWTTMCPRRTRVQHRHGSARITMPTRVLLLVIAIVLRASGLGAQTDTSRTRASPPPSREHQELPGHGHGIDPLLAIHFGFPAGASASLGSELWLGDRVPGAVFASIEPGAFAVRYAIGYLKSNGATLPSGTALRLTQLRAWTNAAGVVSGVRYTGAEITEMLFFISAKPGLFVGRRANGRGVWLASFDFGFGF